MGDQSSVHRRACTMTNNLSIEQIDEDTNVVPSVPYLHIGQIADDEAFAFHLFKLTIQFIRCLCLITTRFVELKLGGTTSRR